MPEVVRIELAYALPDQQWLRTLVLAATATVADALRESHILTELSLGDANHLSVGIFGRLVPLETRLQDGDRVEIYRPLEADPKDSRRRRMRRHLKQR